MSNNGNSGKSDSNPVKSGGANRRKRSYRHFGPSGTAGDAASADQAARTGPVEQKRDMAADRTSQPDHKNSMQPRHDSSQQKAASGMRPAGKAKNRPNRTIQNQGQSRTPAAGQVVQAEQKISSEAVPQDAAQRKQKSSQQSRSGRTRIQAARPGRGVNWEKRIKAEETYEDIKSDIERIEKEIWLEIAGLHTIKLDY